MRYRAALTMLTTIGWCAVAATTRVPLAGACEPPPPELFQMVTFTGVATARATSTVVEGEIWIFDVQSSEPTPPPELGDAATVAILRSTEPGGSAGCQLNRPELQVGATYKVTAGRWSESPILRASLFVGGYSLVAPPPVTTAAAVADSTSADVTEPGVSRFVWLLGCAIAVALAIALVGFGATILRRRTGRAGRT